jgi:hypothetical protein
MIKRIIRRIFGRSSPEKVNIFLDKYEFEYRIAVIIALGYLFYIHYG